VDAKFQVADKLPEFLGGVARRMVSGNIVGLDLSGVVEHAPDGTAQEVELATSSTALYTLAS